MYDHLLVATDGGKRASLAVDHAIELATGLEASLTFLMVVDVRPVYSRYGLAALPTEDEIVHEQNRANSILNQAVDEATDRDLEVETRVTRGTPHLVITELGAQIGADAIVIGRPRRRTLSRMIGVSTADRVVRNAECTVIVVRGE